MYIDQLRKRSEVLGVQSTLGQSSGSGAEDAVLGGKVAMAVFQSAIKALGEKSSSAAPAEMAAFVTSLLAVADEFDFAKGVRKEIKR